MVGTGQIRNSIANCLGNNAFLLSISNEGLKRNMQLCHEKNQSSLSEFKTRVFWSPKQFGLRVGSLGVADGVKNSRHIDRVMFMQWDTYLNASLRSLESY